MADVVLVAGEFSGCLRDRRSVGECRSLPDECLVGKGMVGDVNVSARSLEDGEYGPVLGAEPAEDGL